MSGVREADRRELVEIWSHASCSELSSLALPIDFHPSSALLALFKEKHTKLKHFTMNLTKQRGLTFDGEVTLSKPFFQMLESLQINVSASHLEGNLFQELEGPDFRLRSLTINDHSYPYSCRVDNSFVESVLGLNLTEQLTNLDLDFPIGHEYVGAIISRCRKLEKLRVKMVKETPEFGDPVAITPLGVEEISPHLRHIAFGVKRASLVFVLDYLHALLTHCHRETEVEVITKISNMKATVEFTPFEFAQMSVAQPLPHFSLSSLSFDIYQESDWNKLMHILEITPSLRKVFIRNTSLASFPISRCANVEYLGIVILCVTALPRLRGWYSLKSLEIGYEFDLDHDFVCIARNLPLRGSLEELRIKGSRVRMFGMFDDLEDLEDAEDLGKQLSGLKVLEVDSIAFYPDGLLRLIQRCPLMEHFQVNQFQEVGRIPHKESAHVTCLPLADLPLITRWRRLKRCILAVDCHDDDVLSIASHYNRFQLRDERLIPSLKRHLDAMPSLMHLEVAALWCQSDGIKFCQRLFVATRCYYGALHLVVDQGC